MLCFREPEKAASALWRCPALSHCCSIYLVALLAAFSTISALVTLVVGSGVGAGMLVAKNARYLPRAGNRRQYVRHQHQRPHQE